MERVTPVVDRGNWGMLFTRNESIVGAWGDLFGPIEIRKDSVPKIVPLLVATMICEFDILFYNAIFRAKL